MSSALDLEFIQRSPFGLSRFTWLGFSLLVTSLVLLALLFKTYQEKQIEQQKVVSQLDFLNAQPQQKNITVVPAEPIPAEIKLQLESIVTELSMPWNALFEAIENADEPSITLLNVNPNSKKQQLLITGEAKNLQSVLNYIVKLEAQPVLQGAYLQSHGVDEANTSKPVKFTIMAHWLMAKGDVP